MTNRHISINEIIEDMIKDGVEHSRETMMEIIMLYNRKSTYILNTEYSLNRSLVNSGQNLQEKLQRNNLTTNLKVVDTSTTEAYNINETEIEHLVGLNGVKLMPKDIINSHQKEIKTNVVLCDTNNDEEKVRIIKNTENIPACGVQFHNWLYKS